MVKAHSMDCIRHFYDAARVTKSIIDLTITLLWDPTDSEMQEILNGAGNMEVIYLYLEGSGSSYHSFYTTAQGIHFILNVISSDENTLGSVSFAYLCGEPKAATEEHTTFVTDKRIVTTGLHAESPAEWFSLKQYVSTFQETVSVESKGSGDAGDVNNSDDAGPSDNMTARLIILQGLVETHQHVTSLSFFSESRLLAKFDVTNGNFHGLVESRFPMKLNERFLYAGALRRFALDDHPADPKNMSALGKVLRSNPLLEVAIGTKEAALLSQIVFCCRFISGRSQPLQMTFNDATSGKQERILAKLIISSPMELASQGSKTRSNACELSFSDVDIRILEWTMDCVFGALTGDEAAVLDTATAQFPTTLTYWSLDVSNLTNAGAKSIGRVLFKSRVQSLRIKCNSFDSDIRWSLVLALSKLRRSSLLSLILCGEAVDIWLQQLAEAAAYTVHLSMLKMSPPLLQYQLVRFEVINTARKQQSLSAMAVEAILQVFKSCSLIEFSLVNIDLPSSHKWDLAMAEVDVTYLVNFNIVNKEI
ncbi:hypothetical protein BGZ74_005534 [Mortierella antarctica]|nr:hypothetical protein BGZ74_005534 [Mortierella antarctica]